MKIAIYVRVSKRDMNPDNQRLQLEEYANRQGWEFRVFEERESTRKTRPIKQELLTRLRKMEYDGVLVWKLDRWARSLQELIMDVTELMNRKITFTVLTEPIDTSSPSGMLTMQILGAIAQFERSMIRERTMAGLERARAQGKTLGRPKGKSSKNIPTDEAVSLLLAQGKNDREIATLLDASRYMVQKAIDRIREKNNQANTGGDLEIHELG
jgi:DNA invertase Pin-like site-specific DNA recombinase